MTLADKRIVLSTVRLRIFVLFIQSFNWILFLILIYSNPGDIKHTNLPSPRSLVIIINRNFGSAGAESGMQINPPSVSSKRFGPEVALKCD